MNYQKLIIAGNATKDAQSRQSRSGEKTFTTFDVGLSDGKDKTTYFPVVVFGKQGEAVAKNITKGRHVLIEGRVPVNDKGHFNVVADWVQFGSEVTAVKEEKPTE